MFFRKKYTVSLLLVIHSCLFQYFKVINCIVHNGEWIGIGMQTHSRPITRGSRFEIPIHEHEELTERFSPGSAAVAGPQLL